MEPHAVSVGPSRLNAPELSSLVHDVTKTLGLLARPFGIYFPPASDEEADAIAAPAARMLTKAPAVQKVVRQVADPIVLTGAIVALFTRRTPQPGAPALRRAGVASPPPTSAAPAAAPTYSNGAVPTVDAANAAAATAAEQNQVAAYLGSILDGISRSDVR